MVGESCFEGVLCKTDVGLRWFVVICFDRCLVDYGRLKAITVQRTVSLARRLAHSSPSTSLTFIHPFLSIYLMPP